MLGKLLAECETAGVQRRGAVAADVGVHRGCDVLGFVSVPDFRGHTLLLSDAGDDFCDLQVLRLAVPRQEHTRVLDESRRRES